MRLGEILLGERLVTPEGIEAALEAQVVHGGRLGTNLVELGLLSEKDLARSLGKSFNCSFASGEMKPDPKALGYVPPDLCDEKDVMPMRVDATRITLAVVNPDDLATFDAIAFKTGKRVVPVVIPEFRMNQLLRRYCKAFRNVRAIDLALARPKQVQAAAPAASADLMSEEEFQALYAKALTGAPADDEETLEGEEILEPLARTPRPPTGIPTPLPPSAFTPRAAPPEAMAGVPSPAARALPPRLTPKQVRSFDEASLKALSFAQAQTQLAASEDREEIAYTVLRFALGKWRRALVLSVQGSMVSGWQGGGAGVRTAAVRRIAVALRGQATLKLVRDTRSHYIGPIKRDAGMQVFYSLLGGDYPATAVLLPLLVRGKVVHILYVDNGPGQHSTPDIGELLILGQSVARSYESLLKKRISH